MPDQSIAMYIEQLDHLVLTVNDIDATCDFYHRLLGMEITEFGSGRKALAFGCQKINLHLCGKEFAPHARHPVPGSADLCFLTSVPVAQFIEHCRKQNVDILAGPVERTGAAATLLSVYIRDPDGNLLEIANSLAGLPGKEKNVGVSGISDAW
ncbi:MAG: VOC family protein [Desulfobulbaceae bacterium]|nr:VOC family protein [Desulfobulbaceae bacterium]